MMLASTFKPAIIKDLLCAYTLPSDFFKIVVHYIVCRVN